MRSKKDRKKEKVRGEVQLIEDYVNKLKSQVVK